MFLFSAILLYLIATILGVWSASLIWRARHAKRLQRRGRLAAADRERLLSPARRRFGFVVALVVLPPAGAAFAFGEAVRGGITEDDIQPLAIVSRALAGILVFLALGALYVAVRFDPSHGRRRCPRCWYDMSATAGLLCPECGHEPATEKAFFRTRRAPRLVMVAMLLFVASYAASVGVRVAARGWVSAVPTTALIIGMPWWPDRVINGAGDSLYARAERRAITGWQRDMLRRRSASVLETSDDVTAIGNAAWLWGVSAVDEADLDPSKYPRIGPAGQVALLKAFQADLSAGLPVPRNSIVQAIQLLQPPMPPQACTLAAPIVKKALASTTGYTKYLGLWVARGMGKDATPIVPDLVADAASPLSARVGLRSIYVLAELGAQCPAAADGFIEGFSSPSEQVRQTTLETAHILAPHDPRILEHVRTALADSSSTIVEKAAEAMVRLHVDPCKAKAELAAVLRTQPSALRQHLPRLAAECPDDTVVEGIRLLLEQPFAAGSWVLDVAGLLGPLGKPLLPTLEAALQRATDDTLRDEIKRVIDAITSAEQAR